MSNWNKEEEDYDYEEIVAETDMAWLVRIDGEEYWLPQSQCEINEDYQQIRIPNWLAKEKEII